MVSPSATDKMFWEDTLAWAERTGNAELAATLRANGLSPYAGLLAYESEISYGHEWHAYPELDVGKEMPSNLRPRRSGSSSNTAAIGGRSRSRLPLSR
jgi:proline iminopeptidase